ncbi:MAG: permease [Anaerolineae bacterium CG17_big_fil_post_rev_8_21_14_2_50_57_27]|nr:MAG: permease [Anaerolineae bacterium CG06_land_8_20_14_3_00_57_67]PIW20614.1 MAG: permease [Anaerolineae bacterium CG17_big_fil_post_rev_8_21_14_2_50_57_27]PIX47906.1 MAG: permease [Anaerolineae bacterium CG_4_8_14_3_um_filter_59_70]
MTVSSSNERDHFTSFRHFLIGRPLPTYEAPHQTIGKAVGLAVFASDALSSTAYASEAILEVLAFAVPIAGLAVLGYSIYISLAIIFLLAVVTISYQQTIHAYPGGGGAYIVARDNLGELPAQTAGAALLTDYILTVSVSISSGVAQLTSGFPALHPYRVEIAVGLILLMMVVNLRGVKESGMTFAIPTYFFLIVTLTTICLGFYRYFAGELNPVTGVTPAVIEAARGVTLFLILHAFSSGCTALTGVEAISNGITAFKEPKSRNAATTLIWMSVILSVMFFGVTFLSNHIGAQFSRTETIVSQLGRTVWGASIMWYVLLGSTTLILIMAANTSFADFPRLGALAAGDGFLPRQLTYRGSRLVFSNGIMALAMFASALVVAFKAETTALIPLYAIGVFLSFTLSQTGMAVRWWKSGHLKPDEEFVQQGGVVRYDPQWKLKLAINGFGAVLTAIVMSVFAVTKFLDGAWIVILLIPTLVFIFFRIHYHYKDVAASLSLEDYGEAPRVQRNRVLLLISGVHRGVLHTLRYARSFSNDITAIYVTADPLEEEKLKKKWATWGDGVRLHIIESPYRRLIEPLIAYIDQMADHLGPHEMLTVVVPQFVPKHWIHSGLHMNTASLLRKALLKRQDIVIMEVPYHLGRHEITET